MSTIDVSPIIAAAALATLAACSTPTTTEPAVVAAIPVATPPVTPAPPIDLDRLDELLTLGDAALKEDRLLTPVDDSAYDYFSTALEVAPNHPAARAGLDKLVDRYLVLAAEAAQAGRYDRAKNLLERAKFVNETHDGIALAESQLAMFERAKHDRIDLDGAALSARSKDLAATLVELGRRGKSDGIWVTITARNDAEGRWIYQQLRRAPGERRIRAELVIGATASVRFFELDVDDPL